MEDLVNLEREDSLTSFHYRVCQHLTYRVNNFAVVALLYQRLQSQIAFILTRTNLGNKI